MKSRLCSKGVVLHVGCSLCDAGLEDLRHIFFVCPFASACWEFYDRFYDMSREVDVPSWLLAKLCSNLVEEALLIAEVLWGVWFFRNQKVWEGKVVSADVAMNWSAKTIGDWREARDIRLNQSGCSNASTKSSIPVRWCKPELGVVKHNVDAAFKMGETSCSLGLVVRDSMGTLVIGKTVCKSMVGSVLEAEAYAVLEGLRWLLTLAYNNVIIESDSLNTVRAIQKPYENVLEVGNILDACSNILKSRPGFSISFVKRQANRVAHLVAKLPCSPNCQNVFTAPPIVCCWSLFCMTFLINDIHFLFKNKGNISKVNTFFRVKITDFISFFAKRIT